MASDLFHQSAVATTGATLTSANYLEDKVNIISPDSLLDFQVITSSVGGLSLRDIVFCITAIITIRAALRIKALRTEKKNKDTPSKVD